ncbi:MAG: hypothetical protein ACRD8A_13760 [Candidatus Acidiferrales bacterium]
MTSLLILIGLGACLVYVVNLRTERRAEALLRDVRALQPGKSTEADAQRILARYGESEGHASGFCDPLHETSHMVDISNSYLNLIGGKARILRPFGNQFWHVSVFLVTNRGYVCAVLYRVRAALPHGVREVAVDVHYVESSSSAAGEQYALSNYIYKDLLWTRITVTTEATEEERKHAFDFDLSCLAGHVGCQAGCEITPSSWIDYQTNTYTSGTPVWPKEFLHDHRCKKAIETR